MTDPTTSPSPAALEGVARKLDTNTDPKPDELESMLSSVKCAIHDEDHCVGGWLRSRPTWLRRTLLLAALAIPVVPVAVAGLRGDWHTLRTGATTAIAVGLAAFAIACAWLSTRPLQRRGLTRGLDWLLFAGAIGTMSCAAILNHEPGAISAVPAHWHAACSGIGVLVALPAMLAGRLLHRGTLSAPLLTATAAALMANLGLMLRCPVNEAGHCLMGHVSVALWLALPLLLLRRLF